MKNILLTALVVFFTFHTNTYSNQKYIDVQFDKVENYLLENFQKDLIKIKDQVKDISILEVKTNLKNKYSEVLENKISQIIIASKSLNLKYCQNCKNWSLRQNEEGQLIVSPDKQLSLFEIGKLNDVDTFLKADLNYDSNLVSLSISLIRSSNEQVVWKKMYTSDGEVNATNAEFEENINNYKLTSSLQKSFVNNNRIKMEMGLGYYLLPTIDKGKGSELHGVSGINFFIGENYDYGLKTFGFKINVAAPIETNANQQLKGDPLPFALTFGPNFKYTLNPYNKNSAIWSLQLGAGAFMSSGMATGYLSTGVDASLINRYGISFSPIYILNSSVKGSEVLDENDNGELVSQGSGENGTVGGLGFATSFQFYW